MDKRNRKIKSILLILKEPFLDRIPSLKTLIMFLAENGIQVSIITSESKKFTVNSFSHKNIFFYKVKERSTLFELPTSIKVYIKSLLFSFTHKIDYIIGGDSIGNIISSRLCSLLGKKHINFQLEYPQIITEKHPFLNRLQKLENKAIEKSSYIITHDKWHKQFLLEHFKLNKDSILLLPNSSFTPEVCINSNFLQERLNISNKRIVLHSGGFGKWFKCKELAESTESWNDNIKLVFHISHKLEGDPYFETIYQTNYGGKVLYSLNPVSTFELDKLVASADIGIALYSEKDLGYRATYMGLAAGKIGNYLKCGVPVIATKLPSLTYIEEYQCGILIECEKDIANAINVIISNRNMYSENAYRCYRELWYPETYLSIIQKELL
ncbi:glycosyltransferase family protein [Bacteroides ndongoniae]|uniref:hypothetical protein n=1 Tax=Bacteroides ndongoniae TaxID=1903262 RepID=UPI00135634D1|nr:hypothetical protein [Bacteroides ndongoniae]